MTDRQTRLSIFVIAGLALSFLILVAATPAFSHEIKPAVVEIEIDSAMANRRNAIVSVLINIEGLLAGIDGRHDDTSESPNSMRYQALRLMPEVAIASEFTRFSSTFEQYLELRNQAGQPLKLTDFSVAVPPVGDPDVARDSVISFRIDFGETDRLFTWRWDERLGDVIVRADDPSNGFAYATMLSAGKESSAIDLANAKDAGFSEILTHYVVLGFEHILPKGLDHILFVVGLFLFSLRIKTLLLQISVFTVAHSVTLALATLGEAPG